MERRKLNTMTKWNTLTVLAALPLAYAVTAHNGDEGITSIDEIVAYVINEETNSLYRYTFGDDQFKIVGQLQLADGTVLTDVESLASVPSSIHLYSVWNDEDHADSQLVRINMFNAQATLLENQTGFGNVEGMTAVENLNRGPGPDAPTSVILSDSRGREAFKITFLDVTFNDDGTSAWTYEVMELEGGKDLSHWNLALSDCHTVMPGTTEGYDLGVDGSSGFYGIKWDVTDDFSVGEFTIVLDRHYGGSEDGTGIGVLAKGGHDPDVDEIFGPTCNIPPDFVLYAVHTDNTGSHALISIDPITGEGKSEMLLARKYEGLAAAADGTLFAVADRELWRIDPFADTETHLGTSDFFDVEALEFAFGNDAAAVEIPGLDPAYWSNGVLFGFSDVDNTLLIFDIESGEARSYATSLARSDLEAFAFVTMKADPHEKIRVALFD